MKSFMVIGNPIHHSKSPEIHYAFAQQFGMALSYERLLAPIGEFEQVANDFFTDGVGANITVPFKEDALQFADELSSAAKLAGAVNTLSKREGKIWGDNTDGIGLVRDIRDNFQTPFTDRNILIIGAGGASRGVILPIAKEYPKSITVVNRTAEKAQSLANDFANSAPIMASHFTALDAPFDVIVNATSASLAGAQLPLDKRIFSDYTLAYDMMYAAQPTAFMAMASANGARAVDGLGMLVEQAAASFTIWHGEHPNTAPVIAAIQKSLEN